MLKLNHLVEDKIHARSTGPTTSNSATFGGKHNLEAKRLENKVGSEAYGALYFTRNLTVKSDDVAGRTKVY